jgi:4-hydroxybenzoate polyprenyltransferase
MFAAIYATALLLQSSVLSLWPVMVLSLVALVPAAAYVSVINDLTDLKDDLASGKNNRLFGKSRAFIIVTLACCIFPGLLVAIHWHNDALLLTLYLATWTAFSLYSIPPVRLKNRGIWGVLADASGAHLFPTLLVVSLVFRWSGKPIDRTWFIAIAVWSLSYGLRGILWHQLSDLNNDEKIGLGTFALRHNVTLLRRLGNFIVFPAELAALAVILLRVDSRFAIGFLFAYSLLEYLRMKQWGINLVIVAPKGRYSIVMHEYYGVFFPLAFLLSSSLQHPGDMVIIIAHLVLFPKRAGQISKDAVRLIKSGLIFVSTR